MAAINYKNYILRPICDRAKTSNNWHISVSISDTAGRRHIITAPDHAGNDPTDAIQKCLEKTMDLIDIAPKDCAAGELELYETTLES